MTQEEKNIAINVLQEIDDKTQEHYANLIETSPDRSEKMWEVWENEALSYHAMIETIIEDIKNYERS